MSSTAFFCAASIQYYVCTSRFMRVILVQGPCQSYLYHSNFNGRSSKGIRRLGVQA